MNECIFCKIATGEESSRKVFEDDSVVAFLSIKPINPGHLLVVPKSHVEEFQDMGEELYDHVMEVVHRLARDIKTKLKPTRVGLWVHGFEISHAHIHVIPLNNADDVTSKAADTSPEELAAMAERLKDKNV